MRIDTPLQLTPIPVPGAVVPANDNGDELAALAVDELVRAAVRSDRRAIEEVARRFGAQLLYVSRRSTRNEQDAEEAYQSFFANLVEGRAACFVPRRGRAMPFLLRLMGTTARMARADADCRPPPPTRADEARNADGDDACIVPGGRGRAEPGSLFDPYDAPEEEDDNDE
jgi:DNA-directed RNA polymerase specialized sigma24 family protein